MADGKDTAPRRKRTESDFSASLARAKERGKAAANAPEPAAAKLVDFFLANLSDFAIKDDVGSMEAPMFSLSTQPDMTMWLWQSADCKKTVVVEPSTIGRATMHDKDVLIYCTSQIVAAINAGKRRSRVVRFNAADYFRATKRATGRAASSDDYERFKESLKRLRGTQITTNIATAKTREERGFGFIDSWGVIESDKDRRMVAVEVELSRWLYRAIEAQEVLTINPAYFTLRKPLERRLYEIARKHVGKQASWEIRLDVLRDKCGSKVFRLRQFAGDIGKIIEADTLPDYLMEVKESAGLTVIFKPRPRIS